MMADAIVPQQQPGDGDGPVYQPVRQEEADGGQSQAVGVGGDDSAVDLLADQIISPAQPQNQEADGANAWERPRYPRRERRVPARFKDFEMEGST